MVTHITSAYANSAWNGSDDALSLIREARPARHYGWIWRWHGRPARSCITTMLLLLGRNSRVSRASFALRSGCLFAHSSTTQSQEVGDVILPSTAVRSVRFPRHYYKYKTRYTNRSTGGHSSYVIAPSTHIYCFYSCCSSRPETGAVVDPQQRVTSVPPDVSRRGCSGPQYSTSGSVTNGTVDSARHGHCVWLAAWRTR